MHEPDERIREPEERLLAEGDAQTIRHESARRTRRSFLAGAVATAAGYAAYRAIDGSTQVNRLQGVLRAAINADAAISRTVFDERGLAPTYPLHRARPLRLNGTVGLEQALVPNSYRLQLIGSANAAASPRYAADVTAWEYEYAADSAPTGAQATDVKSAPGNGSVSKTGAPKPMPPQAGKGGSPTGGQDLKDAPKVNGIPHISIAERFDQMALQASHKRRLGDDEAGPSASSPDIGTPGLLLTLADILKLPRVEFATEFKCIEGWSNITQWAGVRLRDLIEAYPPALVNGREPRFVYMETPDANYYGGYDMAAARHPQSLLVTEMGGQPLTPAHGAPLRLHMPIKYGYKQLKRIGLISYMDARPDDYWTKLGYDWYAGL